MRDYNQYTYISPIGVISEVKKRLNKYFSTNQLDEAMIGTYIENCIKKLNMGVYKKTYAILKVENFKSNLPEDFDKLNVAFRCHCDDYAYNDYSTNYIGKGYFSKNIICTDCSSSCDSQCETFEILKLPMPGINVSGSLSFSRPELLYVGISKDKCVEGCPNLNAQSSNEIYITGRTIATNFETGWVFFSYYFVPIDEDETGYPMIVDEIWMKELVSSYLFYQFYEDLYNSVTDETANQIAQKRAEYKREYEEKLIIARTETVAPTKNKIVNLIKKDRYRLNPFNIS